jgi:hypothetical protein
MVYLREDHREAQGYRGADQGVSASYSADRIKAAASKVIRGYRILGYRCNHKSHRERFLT